MCIVTKLISRRIAHAYAPPVYVLTTANKFTSHYGRHTSVSCSCLLAVELRKREREREKLSRAGRMSHGRPPPPSPPSHSLPFRVVQVPSFAWSKDIAAKLQLVEVNAYTSPITETRLFTPDCIIITALILTRFSKHGMLIAWATARYLLISFSKLCSHNNSPLYV